MYPPGIRVVKVSADTEFGMRSIGMTGTVVKDDKKLYPGADMAVQFDAGIMGRRGWRPAGTIWSCESRHWRPINPDTEEWQPEEQKELEQV